MSEKNQVIDTSPSGPEDRRQRWVKYGANVVLTTVIVIVLAGVAVWGAQRYRARADVTSSGSESLRPQTVAVIQNLKTPITLVSLYPKLKTTEASAAQDLHQPVVDKLEEYRRQGKNIDVQIIDPIADPAKMDAWLGELKRKYGSNIDNYEKFIRGFSKSLDEIKKLTKPEVDQLKKLQDQIQQEADKLTPEQIEMINGTIRPALATVAAFPGVLSALDETASGELAQKIPDYAGAVEIIKNGAGQLPGLESLSRQCGALVSVFNRLKDDASFPAPVRQYAAGAAPRFEAIKKLADDELAKTKDLGELKLEDIRRKLIPDTEGEATPPAIVVMGEHDVKVIDLKDTWKSGESTGLTGRAGEKPKLRFAGEQQITAAILALQHPTRQKIAFIRNGGAPLTTGGGFGGGEPPLSSIADRLRSYNYDILEKDITGQYQQMAMQNHLPAPPEPSMEELKDALWIVMDTPSQAGPSPELAKDLKDHLDAGGSALCLVGPQSDDLSDALKTFGVEVKPNVAIVHEPIETTAGAVNDFIEQARRQPAIFILNQFGDTPLGKSLQTLDTALVPLIQVQQLQIKGADLTMDAANHAVVHSAAHSFDSSDVGQTLTIEQTFGGWKGGRYTIQSVNSGAATLSAEPASTASTGGKWELSRPAPLPEGVTESPFIPIPDQPRSWGETDFAFLFDRQASVPTFDKATDVAGPLFAGAIAEKKNKGRLVVIGCFQFPLNMFLRMPDPKLENAKVEVARFPGNGELFTNSVFWLTHNEKLMALSPAAMDTARIAPIGPAMLAFWRWGVFVIGLPFLAIIAGLAVWQSRRE